MNVVSLHNVEKSYGTRVLFKDVNITFTDGQRLGLVGVNGTGKSTFLKILAGLTEPDAGYVDRNGKARIYYLAQAPEFDERATLLEAVMDGSHPKLRLVREYESVSRLYRKMQEEGTEDAHITDRYMQYLEEMDRNDGWAVEQEARIILNKLGFPDVYRTVELLSGGQKRRLALAQALLYPCDLLLLDEPTNHLDEASIDWLESYLSGRKGGLLISTHDRYFLDSVCNGILELSARRMYQYEGHYETFLQLKADREAREAATEEKRRQFLKREIEWVRRGAQARSTKQKARLERYEKLKAMESVRRPDQMDPIALKTRLGKTIFDMEHLSFAFDTRCIIDDFTYHMVKHDRIGIVGPNGVGKSTFMQLLDGAYEPTKGSLGRGETVRIAHFKQELPEFDEHMRVLDYIREDHHYMVLGDGTSLSAGQMLERFLFTPDLHGVPIRKLSGGERRRLYLLKLLMSSPNVLLLDEPTNDLDIPTLEVLEEFLDSFAGVIITVCHDRYFLDRVVDKLFVFTGNGKLEIVQGAYSDYRERIGEDRGGSAFYNAEEDSTDIDRNGRKNEAASKSVADDGDGSAKNGGDGNMPISDAVEESKKPVKKGLNKSEEIEYEAIMEELPKIEHLVKGLDVLINRAATDYEKMQSLLADREEAQKRADMLTERWLELEERM